MKRVVSMSGTFADFDAAIKLKPSMGELHENRAVVVWNIEKSEAVPQEVN